MVGYITIEELPSSLTADPDYRVPAMVDGVTAYLTVTQIVDLIKTILIDGSPAALDTLNELAAALGDDPNFAASMATLIGTKVSQTVYDAAMGDLAAGWAAFPIGVPIQTWDHLAGFPAPPTNKPYRYIKLTASDGYNTGFLGSESVTGSAPLVVATAVITDAGSPLNGRTVNLINTERRFIRGGSSGSVENDAVQGHNHEIRNGPGSIQTSGPQPHVLTPGNDLSPWVAKALITDGTNGTPRVANESRSKNVGATFYMRIK